jgi:HPt (histidine-containing phosphotransfer) domain-containing protein
VKTKDFTGIRNRGSLPDPSTVEVPADIADFLDDYVESTVSQLEDLEAAALAYESGADLEENASVIRRILHKLKGEASMVGISDVSELCHQAEFAFEELPAPQKPDMLLRFKDWITAAVEAMAG